MGNSKTIEIKYDGLPEPIVDLEGEAKLMWDHLLEVLPERVLTGADSSALTVMCQMWSLFRDKLEQYQQSDKWTDFSAMSSALKHFNEAANKFGLNPISRSKITPKGTGSNKGKSGNGELDSVEALSNFELKVADGS
jgi:phage terminase small subunit